MSLLITSSKQTRGGSSQTIDIGIEKPYNYINNFQNPLKVPPNSEIAVESVKINREPRIQVKNKLMMGWFGKRFHQTSGSSVSETAEYVIPSLVLQKLTTESRSPLEFADILKDAFNDMYCYHPEFNFNKTAVSVSYSTTGEFAGFEISMETCSQTADARIPDSLMIIDPKGYDEETDGTPDFSEQPILFGSGGANSSNTKIEYDDTSGSVTTNSTDAVACIFPEGMWEEGLENGGGALSLLSGECTFITDGKDSGWWVGLARSHTNSFREGKYFGMESTGSGVDETYLANDDLPDFAPAGMAVDAHSMINRNPEDTWTPQYWDYVVHHDFKKGYVRIFHSVYNEAKGKMCHKEIKYWDTHNGDNSSFATGTPIASADAPTTVKFIASNDIINIFDQNGSGLAMVETVNASTVLSITKPIDQSCWRLYPKICFDSGTAAGTVIQLKTYKPRTATTSPKIWGDDWYGRCVRNSIYGQRDNALGVVLGQTTPQKVRGTIPKWTGGAQTWTMDLAQRSVLIPDETMVNYPYQGVGNGSGMLGKEIINIVGTDSPYTEAVHGNDGKLEWQPNCARQVGNIASSVWPEMATFYPANGSYQASFVTAGVPATTSDRAAYIRVPTLTHESYNGATGNQSKILFQVPKFDNAGNSTGALQFQAQDRLYVDLKNASELNMTDINVQFVGSDERFADDLTGQSSVLFHIRPKL
jgi:hypothetical protein